MKIPMEDWLRGCVYHDGRNGEVTLPTDKVLEIANYIQATRTGITDGDGMIHLPPNEESRTMKHVEMIIDYIVDGDDFQYCDNKGRLIRCKDCKYYQPYNKNEPYDCYKGMSGVKETDYCSFAERMESDEE